MIKNVRSVMIIDPFSSKTRTSFKTQLLFYVLEHYNFSSFSLPESCSQTDKFPKNSLHSRIHIICECAHIASCLPSRRPIFVVQPSKVHFSGFQYQNRTYNKSIKTAKVLRLISLCNLHLRAKNYNGVFLTRVFLLK